MTFTFRQWLWFCVVFGFAVAMLQRPLRMFSVDDFVNGVSNSATWLFWLCYRDDRLQPFRYTNSEFLGLVTGLVAQGYSCATVWTWICSRPRVKVPQ